MHKEIMNILHIINGWPSGGIAEQTYLLCKYLPKDKFKQYSIGYCHYDGAFVKKFEEVGVECIHSDEQYSNLSQVLIDKKIDIVHKQTGGGDCPQYIYLLNQFNIPLVETLHCPRSSNLPIGYVDKIIYTTEYTLQKNDENHKKKMISIMYALDLQEPIRQRAKVPGEPFIVGRLGRVVPDKRPDVILDLAKLTYEEYGDRIKFYIAGIIPQDYLNHIKYGKWFLEEIKKYSNIEYFGFVENKYDFWKQLDVCINPVWETSFDIVFLEAMACGIPILTWDNSAAKYVVGNAGLVMKENIEDLYKGLDFLYKTRNVTAFGDYGISYIKIKYSLNDMIQKYVDLYEGIYNEHSRLCL